jgi:hypothetical protein
MPGDSNASAPAPAMEAPASPDSYRPHIGEAFGLLREGGGALTLTTVDVLIDDEAQLCFSLLFLSGTPLAQGTYSLSHPALGEINLFLVPIQKAKHGFRCEAVFNLLRDEGQ